MTELPTGTVTFIFTDLEGSTRLWEQHPQTMQTALARHDEILRDAVESGGGRVVKTTGDGVHAVFATARGAVAAAAAGQRASQPSRGPARRCGCGWASTPARPSVEATTTSARP